MTNVYPESPLGSPVTATPAAPGTAPGGGAQEAATLTVHVIAAEFLARYSEYCDASNESAATEGLDYARAQRAIGVAFRKCAERVSQLAPAWDALAAERDRYRKALERALHVLEEHDEPDDDARSRALAIISAELEARDA